MKVHDGRSDEHVAQLYSARRVSGWLQERLTLLRSVEIITSTSACISPKESSRVSIYFTLWPCAGGSEIEQAS